MTSTAPRANRYGSPCPSWCGTDHDEIAVPARKPGDGVLYFRSHMATTAEVSTPDSHAAVHATQSGFAAGPAVPFIQVIHNEGSFILSRADAGSAAAFLEQASAWTPEDFLELAAGIRRAAALIAGEAGSGE